MKIYEGAKLTKYQLDTITCCPICGKQLIWNYENMRNDNLEVYCCGKQFIAKPNTYTIEINNCDQI